MIDSDGVNKLVQDILFSRGNIPAFIFYKRFGKETDTLKWANDYVRDLGLRKEIEHLRERILEVRKSPRSVQEVKQLFEARIKDMNLFRLQQIKEKLKDFQNQEKPLFNSNDYAGFLVQGCMFAPWPLSFSKSEMDFLFSDLPEGTTEEEKGRLINDMNARIVACQKTIADELSPASRWYYKEDGQSLPYPNGCRWTAYVNVWAKVAEHFERPVGITGLELVPGVEMDAYDAFGLGKNKVGVLMVPFKSQAA